MKKLIYLQISLSSLLFIACDSSSNKAEKTVIPEYNDHSFVKSEWIDSRVAEAETRLSGTPAGLKVWQGIEAHGGLEKWFSNGPLSFHFDYRPIGKGSRRNSVQVVDQWSVRAVHKVADNPAYSYGWDGKNAWSHPDTADVGVNPRFWATTPFYFVGLPFVLADEGVLLEELAPKEFNGVTYDLVKASYESGVGDAPDDFYVIYIHPETQLMGGLRYIVSYPGFFPDGGHAPEKFMEITGLQTAGGITVPTGYNTYWFKDGQPEEHITKIDVPKFSFDPQIGDDYFEIPEGARIQEGL